MDPTRIRPLKDGPVEVTGTLTLIAPDGSEHSIDDSSAYLCRCGLSGTKPFCDGSHKKAGFEAEGWQRVSARR